MKESTTPVLALSDVSLTHGQGKDTNQVLSKVNLTVAEGEFVAIVGFSGAGKTTLISILAGLQKPDLGVALFRDKEITGPSPERGVVFQSYSLMPWLSVRGNIALAVDSVATDLSASERKSRVNDYISLVGLDHAAERKPAELSGGMRQRVAVARALSLKPQVLLLDEPLSALDALTRARLQDELADISRESKSTIVLITNDVDEALLLADRVIAMTPGPAATLGKAFDVTLAKPRDRSAMNSDAMFIRLRAEITRYLLSLNDRQNQAMNETSASLPDIVPIPVAHSNGISSIRRWANPYAIKTSVETSTDGDEGRIRSDVDSGDEGTKEDRYLQFSQTGKTYPTPEGPLTVVKDFELNVARGEFVTLIGHSGCGKSTVLSMAAGLNPISTGGIVLDGKHISDAGPDRAVVFQAPSLMPWLTARENVALGVDRVFSEAAVSERRDTVDYYLERVGLADAMDRRASELSNGMQQRVGIARAFALSPKLLLLDEPFGMLDSLTRWELQDVLMEVWSQTELTAICVTHDVDEAILLADRVVMMSNGPEARVGNVMSVNLPRPRTRDNLLAHPDYYAYREELLDFLEAYEGGANPSDEVLQQIADKRASSMRSADRLSIEHPQESVA